MTAEQTPEHTPAGALVPQPHGGALRHGNLPGTPAGPGRPPSAVRAALREAFADRLAILETIADDKDEATAERLKAVDLMGKYGLGTTKEMTRESVLERAKATLELMRRLLPPDLHELAEEEMREIWR